MKKKLTRPFLRFSFVAFGIALLLFAVCAQTRLAQAQTRDRGVQLGRVGQLPATAKRYALVIGVDRYDDTQITTLGGAANDAKALAGALTQYAGFPSEQVVLLASDQPAERQPTRGNILRRLSNLATAVPKDGLLVVSFAGHGIERGGRAFLLPSDAQVSNDVDLLEQTAINVTQVKERIQRTGVGQVMILLDACRNDPAGRSDSDNPLTPAFTRGLNLETRNQGIVAFATLYATAVGQRAYEYREKKQGYFTWAFVEGLKGAAANERGDVTLNGLIKFVQDRVPQQVRLDLGAGKDQRPFAVIEGYKADELVLATSTARTTASAANASANSSAASGTTSSSEPTGGAAARSVEQTIWTDVDGDYRIVFLKDGVLRYKRGLSDQWTIGTWTQRGNTISFALEDYVSSGSPNNATLSIFDGSTQGEIMRGEATSKRGKWRWFLQRTGAAQSADSKSTTVEETTWNVKTTDGNYTLQFLRDGALRLKGDDGKTTDGTWKQVGPTIRLVVNNISVWQGSIDNRAMNGFGFITGGTHQWRWSATRTGR